LAVFARGVVYNQLCAGCGSRKGCRKKYLRRE
jgi:hypothetical protein